MLSYKDRANISFVVGLVLMICGVIFITSGEHIKENFGFILFALGGIFWGVMATIQLGAQSTKEITKNVIDTLKHEGLISSNSEIRINENLQVVKTVSSELKIKYDIEKPIKRTAI